MINEKTSKNAGVMMDIDRQQSTATGGNKPAILETGMKILVPLFVNKGDVIRVDTRTGQYLERV
jgi:hypothetical protein